jgi:adenosylcobinamide-GDP ribazoletransferase
LSFLAALRFLTVIRIPVWSEESAGDAGRSTVWFPLVGLIIGLILVGLEWIFNLFLPATVTNGLLIVSLAVITGALHLDGFVDTCDGLAGNKSAEDRWKVMRDSRAGAFGIVGVVLLLLMKFVLLNSIPPGLITVALVLMPVIGRWAMVYAIFTYLYARPDGLGKAFKQETGWRRFTIATVITLAAATLLSWASELNFFYLAGVVGMFVVWIITVCASEYLRRKFSGLTGDTYGAINELAEVGVLLMVSIAAFNNWIV